MSYKQQAGITLIEVILVLAIGASLIIMALRQYEMMKFNIDATKINYAVDIISDAASKYYFANCHKGEALGYDVGDMQKNIDIQSVLIAQGYLDPKLIAQNPLLVADESGTWKGFKLQFNRFEEPRYICAEQADPLVSATGPDVAQGCKEDGKVQIGTVVGWRIQVSAKVKPYTIEETSGGGEGGGETTTTTTSVSRTNVLYGLTSATCVTSQLVESVLIPCVCEWAENLRTGTGDEAARAQTIYDENGCASPDGDADYIAFVRLPTFFASPDLQSGSWQANAMLRGFLLDYDTMPITYLTGTEHTETIENQYFYCGS